MKTILALVFVLMWTANLYSQSNPSVDDTNKIYGVVQTKPQFKGDINKFLADHLNYPDSASNNHIQGTVYVQFVVEKDGSVSSVKVLKGINGGKILENEAVRLISSMPPKWSPGMQDGKPVRAYYMIPIRFIDRTHPSHK